jgi:hypothetical protein
MPSLNSPIITGDVSGGLHTTSVDKLKGNAVAATAPTNGQTLVWSGTAWTPATPSGGGGGGANGLTYYLNQGTNADAPTINLPGTPKQLGRSADASQTTAASGTLTQQTWTQFAGFVSESTPQDPGSTDIPAGLWDFNVWLLGVADNNHSNSVRAKVFKYDGSAAPTLLATSAAVTIGTTAALVGFTVMVPETAMLVTDRIFVTLEAFATHNNHSVTGQFGGNTPSHVHTSLGLVAGTGLWKNVAGVLQSPASLLVDADVDANAAIAWSKIDGLTDALGAKAAQAQVDVYSTAGTFTWTKPANAKSVHVALFSGGGGGGSGRKTPSGTAGSGGGGGAGGNYSERILQAALLGESVSVTVGAGGQGGAAVTTNPVGGTNGNVGIVGGNSSFGTFVTAFGGGPGGFGTITTGAAGSNTANSVRAMFLGGAGNTGNLTAGGAGTGAGTGAAGGGGGGGIAATPAASAGGNGGTSYYFLSGGQASGGAAPGGNGGVGPSVATNQAANGGGGAGGASSITGNAGNGGTGGLYGGGGGGGGAALVDIGNSGAGGNGAPGIVVVTTYF